MSVAWRGGTGGNQRAMHDMRVIIAQRLAGKIGHHAAGFVHQKVGRRKVPVMAAGRGEGGIERAMRDAGQPQAPANAPWAGPGYSGFRPDSLSR